MIKTALSLTLAALMAVAGTADAKPILYDCTVTKKNQRSNWIADKMVFVIDGGGVRVIDQHVLHFLKAPTEGQITKSGNKLTVRWLLTNVTSFTGEQMPPSSYRTIINTQSNTFVAYATSTAYSGARMRASGSCATQTDGRLPKVFR